MGGERKARTFYLAGFQVCFWTTSNKHASSSDWGRRGRKEPGCRGSVTAGTMTS